MTFKDILIVLISGLIGGALAPYIVKLFSKKKKDKIENEKKP
jgi:H+/Cl- antiporter ClcA